MPVIPFDQFAPDSYPGTGFLAPKAENVQAFGGGYYSVKSPEFSVAPQAFTGRSNILWYDVSSDRQALSFMGTDTRLYRQAGGQLEDISRRTDENDPGTIVPYTAHDAEPFNSVQWRKVAYGDDIYVINGVDTMQKYSVGQNYFKDVILIDVDGVVPIPGTDPEEYYGPFPELAQYRDLTGRYMTMVRDFNIIGNCIAGGPGAETIYALRVWWSGIGQPERFEPDPSTMADYQDIPDMGEVRGLTGGDYCCVLMERGVVRMDFVGPPVVFTFKPVMLGDGIGCDMPNTVIRAQNKTFYHAQNGWYIFDGVNLIPIGDDRINRWWVEDMATGTEDRISAAVLPEMHSVGWLYTSNDAPAYPVGHPLEGERIPNRVLLYSLDEDRWSVLTVQGECLGNAASDTAITLEGLDTRFGGQYDSIDAGYGTNPLMVSMDSDQWLGTAGALASIFQQNYGSSVQEGAISTFAGSALPAVLDTVEKQLSPPDRATVTRAIPLLEGNANTVKIQAVTRVKHTPGNENVSVEYEESEDGSFRMRSEGRYHRFRLRTYGNWDRVSGVDVEFSKKGRR